ncbi:MAG: UDP-N-acetyl glucosamine 2-epimerase [Prevotella sp.]|nr:UDP-N-acetyl glucosamine 2-epimerase [Prevotella sp.]
MLNICIFAGARPNFIKVAPIIKAIKKAQSEKADMAFKLVFAGTAGDATLEPSLFDDLQIGRPDVFLGVDSTSLNEITGRVMGEFEKYLDVNATDVVIVVDDLASTMAAAIVTKKRGIKLAHLVAGTRSFDINMPKEINRLVIDALSDLLFTAGEGASTIAAREGANLSNVYLVGNILMDTLRSCHNRLRRPAVFDDLHLEDKRYIVFTINRHALLANKENLRAMIDAALQSAIGMPIVAPLRGTARDTIAAINPEKEKFIIIDPLPYLEFGYLTAHAAGIVTDSGNVAEEATFNAVPCAMLNSYTEHSETVKYGSSVLVGEDAGTLRQAVADMTAGRWKKCSLPDRWDGRTAERIIRIIATL